MTTTAKAPAESTLPDEIAKRWYTLREVMQKLKKSRSFIYRKVTQKKFKKENYGGQAIFLRSSVDAFFARWSK